MNFIPVEFNTKFNYSPYFIASINETSIDHTMVETLKSYYLEVITGSVLGDGMLRVNGSFGEPFFRLRQSTIHAEYLFFMYFILESYTTNFPMVYSSYDVRYNTVSTSLLFNTRTNSIFRPLYNLFYPNGVKRIPVNIKDLLTPIALAMWIQDDGHFDHGAIYLNTQSFHIVDLGRLITALEVNLGL